MSIAFSGGQTLALLEVRAGHTELDHLASAEKQA